MKRISLFLLFLIVMGAPIALAAGSNGEPLERLDPNMAVAHSEGHCDWYDIRALGIEGQGWKDVQQPFDRLPARAEGVVRPPVWSLSHHSAGLCVRFVTDSRVIEAKWKLLRSELAMNHMAATGVSGLDLYARDGSRWRWVGVGRPKAVENEATLVAQAPPGKHEYLLYLPLYNGVESVTLGIETGKTLAKAPARKEKPIVFYGTSITQGGCASRPGMAYTAQVGRHLDWPVINLGFSGNGKMEPEIATLLAELDPAIYVIDSTANMTPEQIAERAVPLVHTLRAAHADTPIVMVEEEVLQNAWFIAPRREAYQAKDRELRKAYKSLIAEGVKNLHYIEAGALLGDDGEATVDGTHPTDLGFTRMAAAMEAVIRPLLAR